jgi:hypothetical protein
MLRMKSENGSVKVCVNDHGVVRNFPKIQAIPRLGMADIGQL